MADLPFHAAVSTWFQGAFPGPTPIQARAWPILVQGKDVLLAAPTGSGKTLCAFLASLSQLASETAAGELKRELSVLYVSPLKALGNDIERNLQGPLLGIAEQLGQTGQDITPIVTAVRSGDTPTKERARMLKEPPHVLVTTPESLYILLTSERGRQLLGTTRTVIIDEIHALLPSKRGAHLALSLERLDALCRERSGKTPQRVGLSATMRPLSEVRAYLCGSNTDRQAACQVIDEGHTRPLHIELWVPGSPLEAVTSAEVWTEIYDELALRIGQQKTTLVFCNTRKQTERVTRFLEERLGPGQVASHHGSLAKELRERAEKKLATGQLRALVATASLELGIDVGDVELVCQLGSPASIATLLQRIGRAGHQVGATSRGLLIPTSRDQLVECLALLTAHRAGALETLTMATAPLDILAQQTVAILASGDHAAADLLQLVRGASPYRALSAQDFESVVHMLEHGFATSRGRRSAYVHRDETSDRLHARRGARLAAITSGGAIPDSFDYDVLLMPEDLRVGSVHEDFAIESSAGDVFQLGNRSYQIEKVDPGTVRVRDATGMLPNLPFWLGEAPSRSPELSHAVSALRRDLADLCDGADGRALATWSAGLAVVPAALEQVRDYLGTTQRMLGVMPSEQRLVVERFFDQVGGMHVVVHATFGARVNRALGLLLRKRICRGFNVELQAAAGEDAILLSLGPMHSFPLEDLRHYLREACARDTLVQALLDSPMFQTRFRWNASRALAILRLRSGRRVPPRFQRMDADDLLAQCFPDQVACLENIQGDREIPDHPLVRQTIEDCLHEAMDVVRLERLLGDIASGRVEFLTRDVTEPSPLAQEILSARPYAFLDDAPLEERRSQAVRLRRQQVEASLVAPTRLTSQAIREVLVEARPDPRDADELHDALAVYAFFLPDEIAAFEQAAGQELAPVLLAAGRAEWMKDDGRCFLVAKRNVETLARGRAGDEDALEVLVRGRLEWAGPTTGAELAEFLGVGADRALSALHRLEQAGFVLRGRFREEAGDEFCERRLLARMHRATLGHARREIEPVSPAQLLEFFTRFQGAHPEHRRRGVEGTFQTIAQLSHFPAAAADWEAHILPARVLDYDPSFLDILSESGRVAWLVPAKGGRRLSRSTPILLAPRQDLQNPADAGPALTLSSPAAKVLTRLRSRGAAFPSELTAGMTLLPTQTEALLAELVSAGVASTDGFCGLRALIRQKGLGRLRGGRRRLSVRAATVAATFARAGRMSLTPAYRAKEDDGPDEVEAREAKLEAVARRLLGRWGVVVRHVIGREPDLPPWRDLLRIFHRLEARGEIRGGRFVTLYSGEQFALAEALPLLRRCQKEGSSPGSMELAASDPLNLSGFISSEAPAPRGAGQVVLLRAGHYEALSSTAGRGAALVRMHHRS